MSRVHLLPRALAALVVCAAPLGCLFGELEGIPCSADTECPTTYFCDLPRASCQAVTATDGIPSLEVPKVAVGDGPLELLPKVPQAATTPLRVQIENVGAGTADRIALTFEHLKCASFNVDASSVPETLAKDAKAEISVDVTTGGPECASVKIIDWGLVFSGRSSRGTFDLDILEPQ